MITKSLMLALILCESSGNPLAVSGKDARGLTQLTDIGVKEVSIQYGMDAPDDIFDPYTNVMFGTLLLEFYYRKTGTIKGALIAYNGGYKAYTAWRNKRPMPEETVEYVRRVMKLRWEVDPTFFRIPGEPQNDMQQLIDRVFENKI
jgi:soluble lytic murein transglycosylase-like protein